MIKLVLWMVFLAGGSYILFCALLYSRQRSMLYYPVPESRANAEVIRIDNGDVSLKNWHVPGEGKKALLYFGGNAEDVTGNIAQFRKVFPNIDLFLHNYRGYGGSSGRPTEEGLYADSTALYDHIADAFDEIIVMGRSLGTGVAVYLASERSVEKLILVTPYDSMVKLASSHYPFVPVEPLLKDRYESASRIPSIKEEILVLIAEHDEVIPRKRSDALVSAIDPQQATVRVISSANHNSIQMFPEYETALREFVN